MTTWLRGVNTDNSFYSNPITKDRDLEKFFTEKFRTGIDNLPFKLYTNYKVYIKCQILYFLYLNQHQKFTIGQIMKPIINFVMKHSKKRSKLKRKEVEFFCSKTVRILAKNLTILSEKYNKTKFNKYFFNPAYEQLFDYDLFWNEAFIAELEKKQNFHFSPILKFVKILDFIGDKVVSSKQIANSYLFGNFPKFELCFLQPLIRMKFIRKFKQGKYCFYCLNN